MVRSEQHRYSELPVWIGRLAEGLPRNIEEGSAVPRHGLGAAAHDEGVSHCALRGFDGEESVIVVAVVGDVRDGHEREGRAPGARPLKEEGARLPERLAAARRFRLLEGLQGGVLQRRRFAVARRLRFLEGVLQRRLIVLQDRLSLLQPPLAGLQLGLPVSQALLPGMEMRFRRHLAH